MQGCWVPVALAQVALHLRRASFGRVFRRLAALVADLVLPEQSFFPNSLRLFRECEDLWSGQIGSRRGLGLLVEADFRLAFLAAGNPFFCDDQVYRAIAQLRLAGHEFFENRKGGG